MTLSTRSAVLSLYMRVFRIARAWQAQTGIMSDTEAERKYIVQEARTLFRQNQQLTDQESIRRCIEECEARIEIVRSQLFRDLCTTTLRRFQALPLGLQKLNINATSRKGRLRGTEEE
ncbi:LYR motif containing protein 1 [Xenoophorus captivus]|uniref:LYR motif containing protein 1 n=1 Tax=Xenoophorus captivus TaxID=1517983 RepID=A0ABV0SCQ7_9TELE